jgi:DNA-binding response OmpR family regulator
MHRILLVEDTPEYQALVQEALVDDATTVTVASTLAEARLLLKDQDFALILLDVTLPDGDGFTFCASLRQEERTRDVPIVFLTGRADVAEKVMGFSLGADDYISKPIHPLELRVRVQTRIKKAQRLSEREESFRVGNLRISLAQQRAFIVVEGSPEALLDLTPVQFKLLVHFARQEDRVFSREDLMNAIRGENVHVSDRTMDTHVSNLRKRIAASDYSIKSIYGVGYSFVRNAASTKKAA